MKILVIGGGGREHALVWKLRQSPQVEKLWCAPGNGGISQDAECVAAPPSGMGDVAGLAALAERLRPDLTVVGPELPLVNGIVDEFTRRGMKIVGPSQAAAQLEGSKVFAKDFLVRHGIPAAATYGVHDSPGAAYSALCAVDWPVVIKADGLCAGKGVLVAPTPDDATAFIERLMDKKEFGAAGEKVLLEEALEGEELSYIVLTDGEHVMPMAPAQDHKRVFDGDQGPNTGGMGAYSIDGLLPQELEETIRRSIVEPTIQGLVSDGMPYRGFLYFGLMVTPDGPKVLEFNCRMGDPEAQAVVLRMDFDLAEALMAVAEKRLHQVKAKWNPAASACVVMASGGYPGEFVAGKKIEGLPLDKGDAVVFHAGTKRENDIYYTCSGRVLAVGAPGRDLAEALKRTYEAVSRIRFEDTHYRKDIGARALKKALGGGA
ncbi:MAG: phosphoribosylamine--glycine ligase [Acidobacteria bacterium]|nr:phosphoribosylamine--glycine ligase [Acidobacteriota bacterium]